jgi:hypothetical protein
MSTVRVVVDAGEAETGTGTRMISQGRPRERDRRAVWVVGLSQRLVVLGGRRVEERMERPRVVRSDGEE